MAPDIFNTPQATGEILQKALVSCPGGDGGDSPGARVAGPSAGHQAGRANKRRRAGPTLKQKERKIRMENQELRARLLALHGRFNEVVAGHAAYA